MKAAQHAFFVKRIINQLLLNCNSRPGFYANQGLFSCFSEKFYKNGVMRRFKFAGHKVYHGGNSSNILKSFFCGAVSLSELFIFTATFSENHSKALSMYDFE